MNISPPSKMRLLFVMLTMEHIEAGRCSRLIVGTGGERTSFHELYPVPTSGWCNLTLVFDVIVKNEAEAMDGEQET